MSVEGLIVRCKAGDENAFGQLLELQYDAIYAIAWRWCGDADNAQDITQNACLKLAKAIHQFDGSATFSTWLYRLTINCAKDFYKSPNQFNRREESHDHLDRVAYSSSNNEARMQAQQILLKIEELATDLAETLLLVFVQGLNHRQAAKQLGIKESTVSWRIHEARKQLKQLMETPSATPQAAIAGGQYE